MRYVLEVLRRKHADDKPYWQSFVYETDSEQATVASALRELNERDELIDADGAAAEPIRWDISCLQKKCGACAMVIDGVPRMACDTRLATLRHQRVRLEPLRKFPVVADLLVDRSVLMQNLTEAGAWLDGDAVLADRRWSIAYEASRCLQCGLCIEVCPNFSVQGAFGGMAAMVPLARLLSEVPPEQRKRLASTYRESVYGGCGKSLACRSVCPANIDIDNLLSRSNAAAVWHRW
jgi:succinate dehydrogenase / fumarate reductase iron-sulfur subunit